MYILKLYKSYTQFTSSEKNLQTKLLQGDVDAILMTISNLSQLLNTHLIVSSISPISSYIQSEVVCYQIAKLSALDIYMTTINVLDTTSEQYVCGIPWARLQNI